MLQPASPVVDLTAMHLAAWQYPLLFLVGLLAGTVDAIAGGGGLITVPALLNLGLPVPLALGTNKFQSSFGSVSASVHFVRCGAVRLEEQLVGIVLTFVGASAGALAVQQTDPGVLRLIVPWLLVAILIYTAVRPALGAKPAPARMSRNAFFVLFGLTLGFYDGFFGPGAGSFWAIALVALLGLDFTGATAVTKVMNATSNLASLALFAWAGLVHLPAGIAMAAGQLLGGRIGAGLVVTRGARFVRPVFLAIVTLTIGRLLWVSLRR